MKPLFFSILFSCLALPAVAQDSSWKPELASTKDGSGDASSKPRTPPRLDPLAGPEVRLTPKERRGVAFGKSWADNPDLPARGEDGSITFLFGSTLPVDRLRAALCLRSLAAGRRGRERSASR